MVTILCVRSQGTVHSLQWNSNIVLAHDKMIICVSIVWNVGLKESLDVVFLFDLHFYKPLEPFKCTHACDIALQGQEIELCTAQHWRGKNWMED